MFAIEVSSTFSAAHALRLPNGKTEPLHGHDFHVTVKVACDLLDELGTVLDFHELDDAIDILLTPWRNQNLNDVAPFQSRINPSAEQIAEHIGHQLVPALRTFDDDSRRNLRLIEVRLTEAVNCLAIWSPD